MSNAQMPKMPNFDDLVSNDVVAITYLQGSKMMLKQARENLLLSLADSGQGKRTALSFTEKEGLVKAIRKLERLIGEININKLVSLGGKIDE